MKPTDIKDIRLQMDDGSEIPFKKLLSRLPRKQKKAMLVRAKKILAEYMNDHPDIKYED